MNTPAIEQGNRMIAEFEPFGYKVFSNGKVNGRYGRPLKLHAGTSGYMQVNTHVRGTKKTFLLHRLVAAKFLPNPNNFKEVNHKDGNKLNNAAENLEWCSRPTNIQHGFDTGLITPPWLGKAGAKHSRSKAVYQCDGSTGLSIKEFGSIREAGRLTGISSKTINDALVGKLQSAGGYKWKYKQKP